VLIVSDATLPSVTVGCTWVPPLLAALLRAVTKGGGNFKVRIAAAQALARVPSRAAYRIPGSPAVLGGAGGGAAAAVASLGGDGAAVASYASPALQQPGYDAFHPALAVLLAALRVGGAGEEQEAAGAGWGREFDEHRYRGALTAAIRCTLLGMLPLAERLDYVRAGGSMWEEHAPFLLAWLAAEEAALVADDAAGGAGGGSGREVVPQADDEAAATSVGTRPQEDGAAASALVPPLPPHAGITVRGVKAAFDAVAAVIGARVKPGGMPARVHAAFKRRAAVTTHGL